MKCAVLCPGPSVGRFGEVQNDYKVRIGVNRAVMAFACDWWVFADHAIFADNRPAGMLTCYAPNTFVSTDVLDALGKRGLIGGGYQWVAWRTRYDYLSPSVGWRLFSATAAIVLAGSLGFDGVDVFGTDWTNAPDWDGGTPRGMYRTKQRWEDERRTWEATTKALAEKGVLVHRKGYDGMNVTIEKTTQLRATDSRGNAVLGADGKPMVASIEHAEIKVNYGPA